MKITPPVSAVAPVSSLADIVPLTATEAARDVLGDFYLYAALIAHGNGDAVASETTGAPLTVHAARLAAELENVLADNAALRVIAVEALR